MDAKEIVKFGCPVCGTEYGTKEEAAACAEIGRFTGVDTKNEEERLARLRAEWLGRWLVLENGFGTHVAFVAARLRAYECNKSYPCRFRGFFTGNDSNSDGYLVTGNVEAGNFHGWKPIAVLGIMEAYREFGFVPMPPKENSDFSAEVAETIRIVIGMAWEERMKELLSNDTVNLAAIVAGLNFGQFRKNASAIPASRLISAEECQNLEKVLSEEQWKALLGRGL